MKIFAKDSETEIRVRKLLSKLSEDHKIAKYINTLNKIVVYRNKDYILDKEEGTMVGAYNVNRKVIIMHTGINDPFFDLTFMHEFYHHVLSTKNDLFNLYDKDEPNLSYYIEEILCNNFAIKINGPSNKYSIYYKYTNAFLIAEMLIDLPRLCFRGIKNTIKELFKLKLFMVTDGIRREIEIDVLNEYNLYESYITKILETKKGERQK